MGCLLHAGSADGGGGELAIRGNFTGLLGVFEIFVILGGGWGIGLV